MASLSAFEAGEDAAAGQGTSSVKVETLASGTATSGTEKLRAESSEELVRGARTESQRSTRTRVSPVTVRTHVSVAGWRVSLISLATTPHSCKSLTLRERMTSSGREEASSLAAIAVDVEGGEGLSVGTQATRMGFAASMGGVRLSVVSAPVACRAALRSERE